MKIAEGFFLKLILKIMSIIKKTKLYTRLFLISKNFKKNELYHYIDGPDVSVLLPIINKKFLVVSQRREPINKINFEFPCGWVDLREKPEKTASRELFEETGYRSLLTPKKLIKFYEEPGRMNSQAHCFFSNKLDSKFLVNLIFLVLETGNVKEIIFLLFDSSIVNFKSRLVLRLFKL